MTIKTNQAEPYYQMMVIVFFIVSVVAGTLFIVKNVSDKKEASLKADGCSIVSRQETGKLLYCGKACWTKEVRVERYCSVSNTTKVWFE